MNRTITVSVLLLLSVNAACGDRRAETPTSATPPPSVPPVPQPLPPLITYLLTGDVVDSDDAPVGAATVTASTAVPMVTVQADTRGRYQMSLNARQPGAALRVEHPGYESGLYEVSLSPNRISFLRSRLHPVRVVHAGESFQVRFNGDDPICGFDSEWACQRVRIRSSEEEGPMVVWLDPPPGAGGINIATLSYQGRVGPLMELRIGINAEIAIDVYAWWNSQRPLVLTVHTRLDR